MTNEQPEHGTWPPALFVLAPLRARTCDPSTEQSSRSSRLARRSSASRAACSRGQTPASVQSRSRRQAVTPEQPTVSAGTSRQATPVRSTNRTPASAVRSGTRSRPGCWWRRSGAGGSNGATRSHRSSGTRSARIRTPCRPRSSNTRPVAQLILKRSVSTVAVLGGAADLAPVGPAGGGEVVASVGEPCVGGAVDE